MPDDDDRPRWADQPAEPDAAGRAADAVWADVVVPDDIRALARDISAYRREVRRAERVRRVRLLLARRGAVPALVLTVAVLIAAVVAGLLSAMAPRTVIETPPAAPIAAPDVVPGTVGGLLPHLTLMGPNGPVDVRSTTLRPAVFALVPQGCNCRTRLDNLSGQAFGEGLPLAIVAPAASDSSIAAQANTLRGAPSVYYDRWGTLAASVGAHGLTVVVVDTNGTIFDIQPGVTDPTDTKLDADLQSMLLSDRP